MDNFNLKKFLIEGKLQKEGQLIKESQTPNISPEEVEKAYQEAYEYETGNPIFISNFDYGNAKLSEVIKIENLISNDEELGDITLVKYPEGWRLAF